MRTLLRASVLLFSSGLLAAVTCTAQSRAPAPVPRAGAGAPSAQAAPNAQSAPNAVPPRELLGGRSEGAPSPIVLPSSKAGPVFFPSQPKPQPQQAPR